MTGSERENRATFDKAVKFAAEQASAIIANYPNYYPMYTVGGKWGREAEKWTPWCEGFFPGILWLLYRLTGESRWRRFAEQYTRPLADRRFDRRVHDLGFIFMSTYRRWFDETGDPALKQVLIDAALTLAQRFQPKGKYLCSFIGPGSLFIDIMMNVGIIFWAARETGDERLHNLAIDHCRTTRRYLVRDDGGTAHEGLFDPATGRFLRQSTHQGWSAESTWSRGLAWALYGFATAYDYAREPDFLDTSRRCADYFIHRSPPGGVPYWDFDLPANGDKQWDSSAAAIAASGLLELARFSDSTESRQRWESAVTILRTLASEDFLASSRPGWEGILLHGIYHYHKGLGVDESVIWGDHFFVEALAKVRDLPGRGKETAT